MIRLFSSMSYPSLSRGIRGVLILDLIWKYRKVELFMVIEKGRCIISLLI